MGEFELIAAIVEGLGSASDGPAVVVGPGDDAAIVDVPPEHQLVTSVDTLVADVHFPAAADPRLVAERALRVSVSDIAAMGAKPLAAVVALVLPKTTSADWVRALSEGFASAATALETPITGGNLTSGELALSITVQGLVPVGQAILRSGANHGDDVWVSGLLGGAAAALTQPGLAHVSSQTAVMTSAQRSYYLPEPQLGLGVSLRSVATSAIDISDGLAADLGHIAESSGVAFELSSEAIPRAPDATLAQALHGGDDYHLCFTAPPANADQIKRLAPDAVVIGCCVETRAADDSSGSGSGSDSGAGRLFLDGEPLAARGFDHFLSSTDATDTTARTEQ